MNRYEGFSRILKETLSNGIPSEFSGLGAVIYRGSLSDLATCPLLKNAVVAPPINQNKEIAAILIGLSVYSDMRHDGFHFIHQFDGLTHLSLFVSPKVPTNYEPTSFGVGARHRSAELISMMEAVEAVVIVEKSGAIRVFVNGLSTGDA